MILPLVQRLDKTSNAINSILPVLCFVSSSAKFWQKHLCETKNQQKNLNKRWPRVFETLGCPPVDPEMKKACPVPSTGALFLRYISIVNSGLAAGRTHFRAWGCLQNLDRTRCLWNGKILYIFPQTCVSVQYKIHVHVFANVRKYLITITSTIYTQKKKKKFNRRGMRCKELLWQASFIGMSVTNVAESTGLWHRCLHRGEISSRTSFRKGDLPQILSLSRETLLAPWVAWKQRKELM